MWIQPALSTRLPTLRRLHVCLTTTPSFCASQVTSLRALAVSDAKEADKVPLIEKVRLWTDAHTQLFVRCGAGAAGLPFDVPGRSARCGA